MDKSVVELFAGVGGFRVGLNRISKIDKKGRAIENGPFNFVWSNQWEPSTKKQYAFECYCVRFPNPENNSNIDISLVDKNTIPNHTLLTGGFPCQDYSVARSISNEKGIEGKKGVLWWQIDDILSVKKPPFILLENVDRLIKSPAKQRGRDFGVMLRCLNDQGYYVEWRVINAAEYGHPQRRRRIFIFACHKSTVLYSKISKMRPVEIMQKNGFFASTFPVDCFDENKIKGFSVSKGFKDLVSVSDKFQASFENTGFMNQGKIFTMKTHPIISKPILLNDIVEKRKVEEEYFLSDSQIAKFKYLRGSKKIPRVDANGYKYFYSEGSMSPYDDLNLPARTMLTSEGTTNRSTHIIIDSQTNRLRLLTPLECERINQFPDNWTNTGMSKNKRYFMMGNSLVCGLIRKMSLALERIIEGEK